MKIKFKIIFKFKFKKKYFYIVIFLDGKYEYSRRKNCEFKKMRIN